MTPMSPRSACTLSRGLRVAAAAAAAGLLAVSGCTLGPRNFENENDRLRREVMQLEEQVEELSAQLKRRLGEIQHLRAKLDVPPDVETPMLSDVELGRYTGAVDDDGDGRDDALVAYVRTLDQKGRFLPVSAEAALAAAVIDVEGETPDVWVFQRQRFDTEAFDRAFRTGLTGTHYTLRLALPEQGELPEEVTLRVVVSPVTSEATFTDQKAVRLRSGE